MHEQSRTVCIVVGLSATVLLLLAQLFVRTGLAQDEPVTVWLDLVNEARLSEGLDPYSRSRLLTAAAQRHADDLAENGFSDPEDVHRGSDGSDHQGRIEEAGYAAWTVEDQEVVTETVWSGQASPQEALASLLDDEDSREKAFSNAYREIGIGIASAGEGQSLCVLTFGARPNVLPIFVNDGAPSTENREVAIRLTNERVQPDGRGSAFMGEAIEIRINNEPEFEELAWQPWAPLVSWLLPDVHGEHTVYVQFRDAAGRTAAAADDIFLDKGTPMVSPSASPSSTSTPPADGTIVATEAPAASAAPGEAATSEVPVVSPSPPAASPSPSSELRTTPFPTWTPLPSPEPTPARASNPDAGQLSVPSIGEYRDPLTAVGILQGLAILLGVLWMILRGRGA